MFWVGVHYDAVKATLGQFLVLSKLSSFRLPDVASFSALLFGQKLMRIWAEGIQNVKFSSWMDMPVLSIFCI